MDTNALIFAGSLSLGVMESTEISEGDEVEVKAESGGYIVVEVTNVDHCHNRIEGDTVYSDEYVCVSVEDVNKVFGL